MAADTSGVMGSRVDAETVLSALRSAIGTAVLPGSARVCAAPDAKSPEEGLALLGAYVAIPSPGVRQAILDAVLMISRQGEPEI